MPLPWPPASASWDHSECCPLWRARVAAGARGRRASLPPRTRAQALARTLAQGEVPSTSPQPPCSLPGPRAIACRVWVTPHLCPDWPQRGPCLSRLRSAPMLPWTPAAVGLGTPARGLAALHWSRSVFAQPVAPWGLDPTRALESRRGLVDLSGSPEKTEAW